MNRRDQTVLLLYANERAYGLSSIVQEHYAGLIERRYAKLMDWWKPLHRDDKRKWYIFLDGMRSAALAADVLNSFLEFSQAFECDEREGVNYVLEGDRAIYDAWEDLRFAVWNKFRQEWHI